MSLTSDDCLKYARECEAMARACLDEQYEALLIELAASWRELAKSSERSARAH